MVVGPRSGQQLMASPPFIANSLLSVWRLGYRKVEVKGPFTRSLTDCKQLFNQPAFTSNYCITRVLCIMTGC